MTQHTLLLTTGYGLLGHGEHHHKAVALLHCQCDAISQTMFVFLIHNEFLNDHLNVMIAVAVQFHARLDLTDLTIHTDSQVTLAAYALKKFLVMALAVAYQRCKHIYTLTVIITQNQVYDLLLGELYHFFTAQVRVGLTRTCKKQTQIVVYLGNRTHRRARIAVCCLLLN